MTLQQNHAVPTPKELLRQGTFILFKRKWAAIVMFIATFIITFAAVYMVEPAYRATALILVRPNPRQQLIVFHELETPGMPNMQVNPARNLVELSQSHGLAKQAVLYFNLHKPKELKEPRDYIKYYAKTIIRSPVDLCRYLGILSPKTDNSIEDAIDELQSKYMDIQVQQDTEIINLTIWGPQPILATEIANFMADLLVNKTQSIVQKGAEDIYLLIRNQVKMAEESLMQTEQKLMAFRLKHDTSMIEGKRELLLKRLDEIDNARAASLVSLRETEQKVADIELQLNGYDPTIVSSTVNAANPVVQELQSSTNTVSGQLAALMVEKAALHPEVAVLQAKIDALHHQLTAEPGMIPESVTTIANPIRQELLLQAAKLKAETAASQARMDAWTDELELLENELDAYYRNEPEYDRLVREKESHADRYSTLQDRMLQLEVQKLTASGDWDIRLIDRADLPEHAEADYPDWEMITYLTSALAIFIALGSVFAVEFLNDAFNMPQEVEKTLNLPVINKAAAL